MVKDQLQGTIVVLAAMMVLVFIDEWMPSKLVEDINIVVTLITPPMGTLTDCLMLHMKRWVGGVYIKAIISQSALEIEQLLQRN